MSKRKQTKPFWEMTTAELAEATKEFDRPLKVDAFGPPPAEARAQLDRARRKRPASTRNGTRTIRVSVAQRLLNESDAFAKRHGLTRSQMIEKGLRAVLAGKAA